MQLPCLITVDIDLDCFRSSHSSTWGLTKTELLLVANKKAKTAFCLLHGLAHEPIIATKWANSTLISPWLLQQTAPVQALLLASVLVESQRQKFVNLLPSRTVTRRKSLPSGMIWKVTLAWGTSTINSLNKCSCQAQQHLKIRNAREYAQLSGTRGRWHPRK